MSEKALREFVGKIKNSRLESIIVTQHCRQSAEERGIGVDNALEYFLNSECEWKFSRVAGVEGRRIEVLKRLSNRRGLCGVFEVNEKVYLITVYKMNTRKQKAYEGIKITGEEP